MINYQYLGIINIENIELTDNNKFSMKFIVDWLWIGLLIISQKSHVAFQKQMLETDRYYHYHVFVHTLVG